MRTNRRKWASGEVKPDKAMKVTSCHTAGRRGSGRLADLPNRGQARDQSVVVGTNRDAA